MRRPGRVVLSTWFAMLTLQTIGSVDVKRKLPAPKQFVAINVLWGILFLLTDTGFGRLAARLSLLILVTASVLGPFGARLVKFLETISQNFAVQPPGAQPSGVQVDPAITVTPNSVQSQIRIA